MTSGVTNLSAAGSCSICWEPIKTTDQTTVLHPEKLVVNHIFHKACIDPWLLKNGACPLCRVDDKEVRGRKVFRAVLKGDLADVQRILAEGEIPMASRGAAVWNASIGNHPRIIEALLADGEINQDHRGLALIDASRRGHVEIANILLRREAIVSPQDRGRSLILAAHIGCEGIVDLLAERDDLLPHEMKQLAYETARDRSYHRIARKLGGNPECCTIM